MRFTARRVGTATTVTFVGCEASYRQRTNDEGNAVTTVTPHLLAINSECVNADSTIAPMLEFIRELDRRQPVAPRR